jgi:CheY-like chemotaxis protein
MYSKKLINEGFEVIGACDGEDALEKIEKCKPDIILTDLIMPNKDGFSLIRDLNDDPDLSKIPKILPLSFADSQVKCNSNGVGIWYL